MKQQNQKTSMTQNVDLTWVRSFQMLTVSLGSSSGTFVHMKGFSLFKIFYWYQGVGICKKTSCYTQKQNLLSFYTVYAFEMLYAQVQKGSKPNGRQTCTSSQSCPHPKPHNLFVQCKVEFILKMDLGLVSSWHYNVSSLCMIQWVKWNLSVLWVGRGDRKQLRVRRVVADVMCHYWLRSKEDLQPEKAGSIQRLQNARARCPLGL